MNHWDERFLGLARHIAGWSKDPSTKVGAVIVDSLKRVVSLGFNGFPRGIRDNPERLNDREVKYIYTIHAEVNALMCSRGPVVGCTLYTWPFMPCSRCAVQVLQAGITRVMAPVNDNERWSEDFIKSRAILLEGGVEYEGFRGDVLRVQGGPAREG